MRPTPAQNGSAHRIPQDPDRPRKRQLRPLHISSRSQVHRAIIRYRIQCSLHRRKGIRAKDQPRHLIHLTRVPSHRIPGIQPCRALIRRD